MNSTKTTNPALLVSPAVALRVLFAYGLFALTVVAYWPASTALYAYWTDVDNLGGTHGLLLLALSLWLIFRARRSFSAPIARPSVAGGVGLLACAVAWLILFRAGIQDLHLALLPALFWFAIYTAFGWPSARAVAFPAGLLLLAQPGWAHVTGLLQVITTHAVGVLAATAGIPVFIEDNLVRIPEGVFEIAGGCSGVHFLVVGLALAALYGAITDAPLRRRAILIAAIIPVALLCNWVRVFSIVVAGHLTRMQHSLITHGHYWFGWALFAAAMVAFIWIVSRSDAPPEPQLAAAPLPAAARPRALVATSLLLLALPVAAHVVDSAWPPVANDIPLRLPVGKAGWAGPAMAPDSAWNPVFVGPHQQQLAMYSNGSGETVEVAGVVYRMQRQGAELVSDENRGLAQNSAGGAAERDPAVQSESIVRVPAGAFRETIAVDASGNRFIVWSVYGVGGRTFVVPLWEQLWYGARSLTGAPSSAWLAMRTTCQASCEIARTRLEAFASEMAPPLLMSLTTPTRSRVHPTQEASR